MHPHCAASSREAACLPSEQLGLTPAQREQQPAAAKKPQAGRKRQREPSPDSDDEADVALLLAELAAASPAAVAAPADGAAGSSGRRSQREGAGANLNALLLAEAELGGDAEAPPTRALPARETALSSPSGSRRRLQQAARVFEDWAQPDPEAVAAAARIPEDEGAGCGASRACLPACLPADAIWMLAAHCDWHPLGCTSPPPPLQWMRSLRGAPVMLPRSAH